MLNLLRSPHSERKSKMQSLAIWYAKDQNIELSSEVEIHFNFWKLPVKSSKKSRKFLDIGINLSNIQNIEKIFIYLPFSLEDKKPKKDVFDLGGTICEDQRLLSAIFNENYKITNEANSDYHQIKNQDDIEVFNIYKLDETNISVEESFDGSIISIKTPNQKIKKRKTYFRVRIETPNLDNLSVQEKNPTSIVSSAFSQIEITDFRINSKRHLPNKLLEEISKHSDLKIKKIHFFYICSYKESYNLSHTPFASARKLEENIWDKYISANPRAVDSKIEETFIAYHWKEKPKTDEESIRHFNILIKTEFSHKDIPQIIKYLLFLAFFTIIIGLLTNLIYDVAKSSFINKGEESKIEKNLREENDEPN